MKKGIFLVLGLMTLATVNATDIIKPTSKIGVSYTYSDAVSFVEGGVQFHIFLNGEFDFNTNYRDSKYVNYYGTRITHNRAVRIERDYYGRVRRVGNTFINYDVRNNVKRVGSVYIDYRFGQLARVGNLKVQYDRWGNPRFYGNVKYNNYYNDHNYFYNYGGVNIDIRLGDVCDYNDTYFYRNDFRRNYSQIREDNNFFYYRENPNAKNGKRGVILKRRKPANTKYSKRATYKRETKRSTNSYRKPASVNSKRKVTSQKRNDNSLTLRKNNLNLRYL